MRKKLYIDGMCCCKCPEHIKEGLEKYEEIKSIEIDSKENTAILELTKDIDEETLKKAVKESGHYTLTKIENL